MFVGLLLGTIEIVPKLPFLLRGDDTLPTIFERYVIATVVANLVIASTLRK